MRCSRGNFLIFAGIWVAQAACAQTLPAPLPALLPVPNAGAQDHARLMIYDLFKEDFAKTTPVDRQALGKRLLTEAVATKDDPAARYALLVEATDLAALAGDPETAYQAAVMLGRFYQVDGLELKKQALFRCNFLVTPGPSETVSRLALDTADEAAQADAFATVEQLVNLAEGAAEKTHKVSVVTGIQTRLADLRGLIRDFPKIEKAKDLLADDPNNADAHLLVGTFYALRKGQWSLGLPHLAASSDAALRALAQRDLAAPTDQLQQAVLGDDWWNYGEAASGAIRLNVQRHACDWYRQAQTGLAGLTLTRIQTRLLAYPVVAAPAEGLAAGVGGAIDLLPLFDLSKDAPGGKWALVNNTLQCVPAKYACIQIPYTPPEEYDLRTSFMRTDGDAPITLLLTSHNKSFGFALDVKGEARFERVAGKIAKENPTNAPVAISNNRRYTLTVQVRHDCVRALLDDKLVTQWKTDYKDLTRYELWKLPVEKLCGLGVNNGRVTFYSVELTEITGKGRPLRQP